MFYTLRKIDETTEAVRIEDEQDIDIYTDPGTTNDDTLALNNDLGGDAIIDEQNLLAIEHDEEERYYPGDNEFWPRPLLSPFSGQGNGDPLSRLFHLYSPPPSETSEL